MIFAEYDYDTDIRVQRREAFEDGIAQGVIEGERRGEEKGRSEGITIGLNQGRNEGISIGQHNATKTLILSMFDAGLDSETISKYTSLSIEEIENYR